MTPSNMDLPVDALVLLIGPAGSGKSTFAQRHFEASQILSSDDYRALVADDPGDQDATADAFAILHAVARARLRRGLLTVVDATNVRFSAREPFLLLAARFGRPAIAIVLDVPLETCLARNAARSDGAPVPAYVVREHQQLFRRALPDLREEGFNQVVVLDAEADAEVHMGS